MDEFWHSLLTTMVVVELFLLVYLALVFTQAARNLSKLQGQFAKVIYEIRVGSDAAAEAAREARDIADAFYSRKAAEKNDRQ